MNISNHTHLLRKKIYAFGTDLIIITLFNKAVLYAFIHYLKAYFLFHKIIFSNELEYFFDHLSPLIFLCIFSGYFIIGHYITNGFTIGKTIFAIRTLPRNKEIHFDLVHSIAIVINYYLSIITLGLTHIKMKKYQDRSLFEILTKTYVVDICKTDQEISYYQVPIKRVS